jgi:hypothetical protein
MPTLAPAQTAFSDTRRYYKLGVKSSNKRYEGHQYGASFLNTLISPFAHFDWTI